MLGVVKEFPVANTTPAVGASYQFIVPAEVVAPNVAEPESQRKAGFVAIIEGETLTVAITAVLVGVAHPDAVAST